MAIVVRDAEPGDAAAIADAHTTAWRVGYRGVVPDEVLDDPALGTARLDGWTRRLRDGPPPSSSDPDNRIFAGVFGDRVVGFGHAGAASASPPPADEMRGEVYGFYVHPDAWGTGVADALMVACLDELRRRAFPTAVLWVLRDNPRARRFYARYGWQPTGETTTWPGPVMPGLQLLPEPLDEIELGVDLRA